MYNPIPKTPERVYFLFNNVLFYRFHRIFKGNAYFYRTYLHTIMKDKKTILFTAAFFILLLATGCRNATTPANATNIEAWLMQDPDSCLWYLTDQYTPLYRQKKYQEIEDLYARTLRAMPEHPKKSRNLNYLMRWILTFYYNALMLQDKVEGSAWLTDSLLNSPNPYYTQTLRPELITTSTKFYLAENRMDKVDSLGRIFQSLSPTDDPRRDAINYYNMAWALEFCDIGTKIPVRLMEHAIKCCREVDGKVGGEGEIYGYMGYLYWKNGALEKATSAIQEAIDWYNAHPNTPGDGLIEANNNLSRVYVSLGLYDKAIEANDHAVAVSKALDNWTLEEVYRLRASCFNKAGKTDSALFYIQKAIEATPKSTDAHYVPHLHINRLGYYYSVHPDSIAYQLEECRRLLKDTAIVDPEPKNNLFVYYGMALLQTPGHEREGIDYMERGFHNFYSGHYPEGILFAGNKLIQAYLQTGMTDRISSVYPIYTNTSDSLRRQENINAAIGANIRYETGRKEQENRALATEVSLKQRTLVFTWLLVGLLLTVLATGGLYVRQRQRYLRRISDARLSQISGLLRELNEVSSELQEVSKRKATSNIRVKINAGLVSSDQEMEFRRSFTSVYPGFLSTLHEICPGMTRTDDLIAMLLILDLNSDGIALTLGISKNGVNKARSRMRQRLGLNTETNLEEFLKGKL